MNGFLQELCDWLNSDRFGRKVLFVRNLAVGNQLLRMAADNGIPAVNVQAVSVGSYMEELAETAFIRQGLKKADQVTAAMALQELMKECGDAFTTLGKVELSTAESVLPLLNEMEESRVKPDQLKGTEESLLAELWEKYLRWKKENGYFSAQEILENAIIPGDTSYAILSDLQMSIVQQEFLQTIPENRLTVIHMLTPEGEMIPRNMILQESAQRSGWAVQPECVVCQDIGSEIRAAFQYLIEKRIPAEDAVIVCPDAGYGLRAEEEGKLLGIPVNSAFGMPAAMTNTSLLLNCLIDWAGDHYDAEKLGPALVSGGMSLYNGRQEVEMLGQELFRIFRESSVGWGKERWDDLAASEDERKAAAGRLMVDWVSFFEKESRPAREAAAELIPLLDRCMARGPENELYLKLADEVSRVYTGKVKGVEYLELVEAAASSQSIGARTTDEPGRAYACSYENALYINRKQFIMLGMSWDAFNRLTPEFPLLHDVSKAALSPALRLVGDGAQERRYAVHELLVNRSDAKVLFSRPDMDHVGGEEIMSSSLFDDAAAACPNGKAPFATILGRKALTELDIHLKNGLLLPIEDYPIDPGREELWQKAFEERRWSATRLETAYTCPRKFTFQVQMGLDTENPQAREQYSQGWLSANERGNLIHEVLQQYFDRVKPRSDVPDEGLADSLISAAVEKYRKQIPVPFNLTDLSVEIGGIREVVLQAARMHAEDRDRITVSAEVGFGREEPLELSFGNHTIRLIGSIDRVDRTSAGYEIVDYKSGAPYRFRREFGHKLQYYLYTLAWEKLHPDLPICKAHYYLLDNPGEIDCMTVEMTDEVRDRLYGEMTRLLDLLADPETAMTPMCRMEDNEDSASSGISYEGCPAYCPFLRICNEVMGCEIPEEPGALKEDC